MGCGLGFVVRAMAASSALGADVELVGVDLNPVLIAEARRLAELEGLACRFTQGDAFRPGLAVQDGACSIIISSGSCITCPIRPRGLFRSAVPARCRGLPALGYRAIPVVNTGGVGLSPRAHA